MSSEDCSENEKTPPKMKGKRHYDQKYNPKWEKEDAFSNWLKRSKKGDLYFFCNACNCDLKCVAGRAMLDKHRNSNKHLEKVKAVNLQPSVQLIFPQSTHKKTELLIKSGEIKMACFLTKNNLAFNIANDLKAVVQAACPDSEIAKQFTFGRTKAQAIVTKVTGEVAKSELISILQKEKFSLIVDESTDCSSTKHLAVIARTGVNFNIEDNFLCLIPIIDGSANTLHRACVDFFEKNDIPYQKNMIGFAADGANTMFGQNHSVATLFVNDIPHLFLMKCVCHSFHLCASYACKKIPRSIEDFAREVYRYIQNSPKRLGDYKVFQEYLDIKPHNLLQPAQTRWLSLLPVVKRLLEQLPTLKLFFQCAVLVDKINAAEPILDKCLNPATELYLEFLSFVLPFFHELNKQLQSSKPKLYILYDQVLATYKSILECFIKNELLELSAEEERNETDRLECLEQNIINLDYKDPSLFVSMEKLYLGGNIIAMLQREDFLKKITKDEIEAFKNNCLCFYIESLDQIKLRFPFKSIWVRNLKTIKFLNLAMVLGQRQTIKTISSAGSAFPGICTNNLTELDREWLFLRNSTFSFCPDEDVEVFWRHISNIKNGDEMKSFPLISDFVRKLLILPHSSANVERLFSTVKLVKTTHRNRLCTETLEAVLHTKRFISNTTGEPTENHFKKFNNQMYNK